MTSDKLPTEEEAEFDPKLKESEEGKEAKESEEDLDDDIDEGDEEE